MSAAIQVGSAELQGGAYPARAQHENGRACGWVMEVACRSGVARAGGASSASSAPHVEDETIAWPSLWLGGNTATGWHGNVDNTSVCTDMRPRSHSSAEAELPDRYRQCQKEDE
jgi:hypothetical protein